jgi:hypothetical protein
MERGACVAVPVSVRASMLDSMLDSILIAAPVVVMPPLCRAAAAPY